jgi:hypothetical protein
MSVVIPTFKDNMEQGSILGSEYVKMVQEIPDTQKAWISQSANTLTNSGGTWQMPNLNDYFSSEIEMIIRRTVVFSGNTMPPAALTTTTGGGTSPLIFDPRTNSVETFGINKLINQIKWNVSNKAWTEVDRDLPELIDLFSMQFDQDQLRSYGIYGKGMHESLHHRCNEVYGSGLKGGLVYQCVAANTATPYNAMLTQTENDHTRNSIPALQNRKGYCVITSVFTDSTGASIPTSEYCIGFEGVTCPSTIQDGNQCGYYPPGGTTITQTVTFEFHEYLISPSASNPYSINPYKKIYYSGGYPFNLSFNFNQNVLPSLVKWKPIEYSTLNAGNTALMTLNQQVVSSSWDISGSTLNFWTFNTARDLPRNPIKTVYFKIDKQTPQNVSFSNQDLLAQTPKKQTINTTNLSSLPPYIILYGVARQDNNSGISNSYYNEVSSATTNHPYYELFDIEQVQLRVQTQNDTLGAVTLSMEELVNTHTLEVLGKKNLEFREFLRSNVQYDAFRDIGDSLFNYTPDQVLNRFYTTAVPGTATTWQIANSWLAKNCTKRGLNFVIIDVAKLNIRTDDGIPVVPLVNYGSSKFKAITIDVTFKPTRQMREVAQNQSAPAETPSISPNRAAVASINMEYNALLMYKNLRTLPILSGQVLDERIEWQLNNVSGELMKQIHDGGFDSDGDNQLQYVGGAFAPWEFVKNVASKVGSFLRPAAKKVVEAARYVQRHTKDNDDLEGIHDIAANISDVGRVFGLGKKHNKYGRA